MTVSVKQLSKRYNYQTIFKNIDYIFEEGKSYAILGPNGSGKSTLLKVLSGFLTPSKGSIKYLNNDNIVEHSEVYQQINYAAPYIQLIEDFTLDELLSFHFTFKALIQGISIKELKNILQLKKVNHKYIKDFSSGMKQRVKLVLALLTKSEIVLLDEPTTNLDDEGVAWYHQLINNYLEKRLIIIASNREEEYSFCAEQLQIMDYK